MKPRRLTFIVVALLAVSLVACKKTEKGESKRWDSGLRTLTELTATYPGFKDAIADQRKNAETAMEAAKKVDDKKKRIEAMSKANGLLTGGFVGTLEGVDTTVKKLKKDMVSLAGDAKTPEEKKVLEAAKTQVEQSLASVETTLKAGAKDAASATAMLKKVETDLKFAQETLGEVSKRVSKRLQDERNAKASANADKAAQEKAAEDAVAPWTCEYCDHQNPHDAETCANCKAARPAK